MKINLFPFQERAVEKIHEHAFIAAQNYEKFKKPQIISLTAPTGAGKTIIMASFIEELFFGTANIPERPESIVVWLSDSPELNQQSLNKINALSDKISVGQTITIKDESFKEKILEEGNIYFLNTQKLGKSSNLTKHSDNRQYTIWEVLKNTVQEKGERLVFIIDEAHRGMVGRDAQTATTIMQKFIKGSLEDDLPPMPVVIGMTATSDRFHTLIQQTNTTVNYCIISPDEVRSSGLLKDRIIISYPEDVVADKDMSVLTAAAVEWKDKCNRWFQYCVEQHYAHVYPIFIIQVLNGTSEQLTNTDLSECLREIEHTTGEHFITGEVVHTFGSTTGSIECNGIEINYLEPSRINDDRNVKIVFFKENLSTGWDCPRAETMMSFRRANDYTYISQLLGRMIRTPLQMRVKVDESLNDVHLYLPYFSEDTVSDVIKYLQDSEGGNLSVDVESEQLGSGHIEILGIKKPKPIQPDIAPFNPDDENKDGDQNSSSEIIDDIDETNVGASLEPTGETQPLPPSTTEGELPNSDETEDESEQDSDSSLIHLPPKGASSTNTEVLVSPVKNDGDNPSSNEDKTSAITSPENENSANELSDELRFEIVNAVNKMALTTYTVRKAQVKKKLYALFELASLINNAGLGEEPLKNAYSLFVTEIDNYISLLKEEGKYDELANNAVYFKLTSKTFDVLKNESNNSNNELIYTSSSDIDKQFRVAEKRLGDFGIGIRYGLYLMQTKGKAESFKTDVIIYVASNPDDRIEHLASDYFYKINEQYRRSFANLSAELKNRYTKITADADVVSPQLFELPEAIDSRFDNNCEKFRDHLYVNNEGYAQIKLNDWELPVLREEQKRSDFVCWVRNMPRKSWALTIPYKIGNETKATYPDLLIIRKDENGYIVDVLEPHDPTRNDNLPKAKAFAKYAKENFTTIGRIELIRQSKKVNLNGKYDFIRLNLANLSIANSVEKALNNEELDLLFDKYGTINK